MAKPILPEILREEIKGLLKKGYTQEAVFGFVKDSAGSFVNSDKQLKRCISHIETVVSSSIPIKRINYPIPPQSKGFNKKNFADDINSLNKRTPLKEIEKVGIKVARDILRTKEGFKGVKTGPTHAGTPFDLFGFKDNKAGRSSVIQL